MRGLGIFFGAVFIGFAAIPAQAEVLRVSSLYPAEDSITNNVKTIAVEPFDGDEGSDFHYALENALEGISVRGERYFDVVSYRTREEPDAIITGKAKSDVSKGWTEESRRVCVEWDEDGDCAKKKRRNIPCRFKEVELRVTVRLNSALAGGERYFEEFDTRERETVCESDESFASQSSIVKKQINDIVGKVRLDLAPRDVSENIRVLEGRKGMEKGEGKAFKAAVKMTKKDAAEACRLWDDMAQNGVGHMSIEFNRALCTEQSGDLKMAKNMYEEAESRFGSKAELGEAIRRSSNKMKAEAEWQARQDYFTSQTDS